MDERRLGELFRDAAEAAPEATFDAQDVVRESRRVTARRRWAAAGGTFVAAAVLVGGVGIGTGAFTPPGGGSHTSVQSAPSTSSQPRAQQPGVLSEPVPRSGVCQPDAQVVAAVAARLPEAAQAPREPSRDCPAGARSAVFVLREGAASGRVTVTVSPAGSVPPAESAAGDVRRPDGAEQAVRKARSGRLVVVVSAPDEGSPAAPYGTRVAAIASELSTQF
ncbi:hypothetical protein GCM10025787_42560 [Saccharopolyspora rosea]|uniref:Uncharacterized protein n=1 Tax=Saccharopolyspora rosea TaxID=524884 RepID=A0ABW3FKE5_9PSEU